MILYINDRLNVWALWVASGKRVVGLGYPGQCAFTRLTPSSSSRCSPMMNEEAGEVERAVHKLDKQLQEVVYQFYLHAGPAESHAKALRICTKTLYNRVHSAHLKIMDYLQDDD